MDNIENSGIVSDVEYKKEKRRKELSILKASNQMLEDAKARVREHYKDDPASVKEICDNIEKGKANNYELGRKNYNASKSDIDNVEYGTAVTPEMVKDYAETLRILGNKEDDIAKRLEAEGYVARKNGAKKVIEDAPENNAERKEKIVVEEQKSVKIGGKNRTKTQKRIEDTSVKYSFDAGNIPSYVQYDVIPLPSKGECYPSKISRLPVAYLTAADENIYTSPNMYRDGKVIDVILKRKILDSRISVEDLCAGDRDAIILWLRATGYGSKFPYTAVNPETGKQYEASVDLSTLKFYDFNLKGDENGFFDYTDGSGNVFKFRFLTGEDKKRLRDIVFENESLSKRLDVTNGIDMVAKSISEFEEYDGYIDAVESLSQLKDWAEDNLVGEIDEEKIHGTFITKQMQMHTVSINGNYDREFVDRFIENMRIKDASDYREYISNNQPGVDFEIDVPIPESDGGGSFKSFLRFGDTVFINQ